MKILVSIGILAYASGREDKNLVRFPRGSELIMTIMSLSQLNVLLSLPPLAG